MRSREGEISAAPAGSRPRTGVPALLGLAALMWGCTAPGDGNSQSPQTELRSALGISQGNWSPVGPGPISQGAAATAEHQCAGAVQAVVAAPASIDPAGNILYAGAVNGGIWKTVNANVTGVPPHWEPLTLNFPSLSISALAMDPTNAQHVVAATAGTSSFGKIGGPDGLTFITSDGGASWSVGRGLLGNGISAMTVNGTTVLASAFAGIFRSTNGGTSWTKVSSNGITNLAADPTSGTRYFAVGRSGVFVSTNGGSSWGSNLATGRLLVALQNADDVRVATNTSGRVFVLVADMGQAAFVAFSDDHAAHFTAMDLPVFPNGSAAAPVAAQAISGAADNATAGTIEITTAVDHKLDPGSLAGNQIRVRIRGVKGNTAANGSSPTGFWTITVVDSTHFSLDGSAGNGAYTGGGTAAKRLQLPKREVSTQRTTRRPIRDSSTPGSFLAEGRRETRRRPVVGSTWFII